MDAIFRTIIVAIGWLAIASVPGVSWLALGLYLAAGALYQIFGGGER